MNLLGSAKNCAAPRTSPRRKASDHDRITLTAAGLAGIRVGAGVGIVCSPDPAPGARLGDGGEAAAVRAAARVSVPVRLPFDPHPASDPVTITAIRKVGPARTFTTSSYGVATAGPTH